jgi:hypothetical protein
LEMRKQPRLKTLVVTLDGQQNITSREMRKGGKGYKQYAENKGQSLSSDRHCTRLPRQITKATIRRSCKHQHAGANITKESKQNNMIRALEKYLLFVFASVVGEFSWRRLAADDDDEVSSVAGRLLSRGEEFWPSAAGAEGVVLLVLPVILLTGTGKRMEEDKKSEVEMGGLVSEAWVMVGVWDCSTSEVCFASDLCCVRWEVWEGKSGGRRGGRLDFMGELPSMHRTG